jgi:hypothetical protein
MTRQSFSAARALGAPHAVLLTLIGALFLSWALPGPAWAYNRGDIRRMVVEEALNSRVPPSLAMAVAKVESDFQARVLSTAGARGVMQIMPKTAQDEFGVDADELWEPQLNIQLGIDFLESLIDRYGGRWDLALSHYNGGTLNGTGANAQPHGYTRKYVEAVLRWQKRYSEQARVWGMADDHDQEGWAPARTRVANSLETPPIRVEVTEIPPVPAWQSPRIHPKTINIARLPDTGNGTLDDFDGSMRQRLFRARSSLDDFAPIVTWSEG